MRWIVLLVLLADTSSRRPVARAPSSGDGAVALAGGDALFAASGNRSAEIFEHRTGKWTRVGDLKQGRRAYTLVRLRDGSALAIGGYDSNYVSSCEKFDPAARQWRDAAPLPKSRGVHAADVLGDGRVIVVGGYGEAGSNSCDLYDPAADRWAAGPAMSSCSGVVATAALPDGSVLVAGGGESDGNASGAAEIFDVRRNSWIATGSMAKKRCHHSLAPLRDGRVLAFGHVSATTSSEIYDPRTGRWSNAGELPLAVCYGHAWAALADGRVLVCGGVSNGTGAQIYDPRGGGWRRVADLGKNRTYHLIAPLPDGRVVVSGGTSDGLGGEVYDPKKDAWTPTGEPCAARRRW